MGGIYDHLFASTFVLYHIVAYFRYTPYLRVEERYLKLLAI